MSPAYSKYLEAISERRSHYLLKPTLPPKISIDDVRAIVQAIIRNTPTSHNSQTNRAIILVGETHKSVWDQVYNTVVEEHRKAKPRMISDEAYGSVIFFTNEASIRELQEEYPKWASEISNLGEQSSGAVQINIWTVLSQMGIGCNLQHYNPWVSAALNGLPAPVEIPDDWKIRGQLVFGLPAGTPRDKEFIDNPIKVY